MATNNNADAGMPQVGLQKVYVKDCSFESPNSPAIFKGAWKPELSMNIATRNVDLDGDSTEVVLELSVEAKHEDTVAFLVEVQQAGIFLLKDFPADDRARMLASYCPAQLYPYAREVVSDLVGKGGFPVLHLQPISFEAVLAGDAPEGGDDATAAATA